MDPSGHCTAGDYGYAGTRQGWGRGLGLGQDGGGSGGKTEAGAGARRRRGRRARRRREENWRRARLTRLPLLKAFARSRISAKPALTRRCSSVRFVRFVRSRLSWPNSRTGAHDDASHYLFLRESGLPIPPALQARFDEIKTITFYVMGQENTPVGNYWTTMAAWPPITQQNYWLAPNGRLERTLPTSTTIPPQSYLYEGRALGRALGRGLGRALSRARAWAGRGAGREQERHPLTPCPTHPLPFALIPPFAPDSTRCPCPFVCPRPSSFSCVRLLGTTRATRCPRSAATNF